MQVPARPARGEWARSPCVTSITQENLSDVSHSTNRRDVRSSGGFLILTVKRSPPKNAEGHEPIPPARALSARLVSQEQQAGGWLRSPVEAAISTPSA